MFYENGEKYIFVSYSHRDSDTVVPIIKGMQKRGYRVWYDEGIQVGTEWSDTIAAHIEHCECFVSFMSENAAASENCRDEISYAKELNLNACMVMLQEQVEMCGGLAMQSNRFQKMFYSRHKDIRSFLDALLSSDFMRACREKTGDNGQKTEQTTTPGNTKKVINNQSPSSPKTKASPRSKETVSSKPIPLPKASAPEKEEKTLREVLAEKECLVHDVSLAVTFLISVLSAVLLFLSKRKFLAAADTNGLLSAQSLFYGGSIAGIIAIFVTVSFFLKKSRIDYSMVGICAAIGSAIGAVVCAAAFLIAMAWGVTKANAVYTDELNGIRYTAYEEGLEITGIEASEAVILPEYQGMKIVKYGRDFAKNLETLTFTGGEFLLDETAPVFSAPKLTTLKIIDASFTAVDLSFYYCWIQNLIVENGTFCLTLSHSEKDYKMNDFFDKLDILNISKPAINTDEPLFCGGKPINIRLDHGVLKNWGSRIARLELAGEGNEICRQERKDWPIIAEVSFANGVDFAANGYTLVRNANGSAYFSGVSKIGKVTLPLSVTRIPDGFFGEEAHTIRYAGTKEQWEKISIGKEGNESLLNGTKEITFGAAD